MRRKKVHKSESSQLSIGYEKCHFCGCHLKDLKVREKHFRPETQCGRSLSIHLAELESKETGKDVKLILEEEEQMRQEDERWIRDGDRNPIEKYFYYESDKNPAEVFDQEFIYASNKKGNYPRSTMNGGKWLIFVDIQNIDRVWKQVRQAVQEGHLGWTAKVSTAKPTRYDRNKKVICVYTYDSDDVKDVMRIREQLRSMGFTAKLPYKADKSTRAGKFRDKGYKNISKYYC